MAPVESEPTKKVCPGPAVMSSGAKPLGSGMVFGRSWAETDEGSSAASNAINTPNRRREDLVDRVGGYGIGRSPHSAVATADPTRAFPTSASVVGHFVHAAAPGRVQEC